MWLAVTIGMYVIALLGAATLGRLRPRGNFLTRFLLCGGVAWVVLAVVDLAAGGLSVETLASLLLFAFVWELSIFMFALVSTSVSVGLLIRLRSGPRSYAELRNKYSTDFMVETRLERLLRDGFLVPVESSYRLAPKSLIVLHVYGLLRGFFRHAPAPTSVANRRAEEWSTHAS
jgi:hypothetical protein